MANWHVRQVKNRRGEFGDSIDQEIMEVIALHIGEDDKPATMSLTTIARMAGVHYNTADNRTKALAKAGWLKIEKRGRFLAYGLTFESEKLVEDERPPGAERKRDLQEQVDSLEREVTDLKEQLGSAVEMIGELHRTITSLSHDLHIVITSHQSDYVKKEDKKIEEDIYTSPHPTIGGFDPELFDRETERQEMMSAIAREVREVIALGTTEPKFKGAADSLIAAGYTPADVRGFRDWWQENGWYTNNGRPSLEHLIKHFKDFKDGVCLRADTPAPNGHGRANGTGEAWEQALAWIQGRAEFNGLSPPIQAAIKAARIEKPVKVGYETDQAMKQFMASYSGLRQ